LLLLTMCIIALTATIKRRLGWTGCLRRVPDRRFADAGWSPADTGQDPAVRRARPASARMRADLGQAGRRWSALSTCCSWISSLGCQIGDPCWEGLAQRGLGLLRPASGHVDAAVEHLLAAQSRRCSQLRVAPVCASWRCLHSCIALDAGAVPI